MNKKDIKYIIVLASLILVFLYHPTYSYANQYSLSINPSLIRINKIDSTPVTQDIQIKNLSENLVDLRIYVKPYFPSRKGLGEISFLDNNQIDYNYKLIIQSIKFTIDDKVSSGFYLAPQQEKKVTISLYNDKKIKAGEYYLSIIFLTNNTEYSQLNSSVIRLGIASNIILDYKTSLENYAIISNFSITGLIQQGPAGFAISLNNISNHYLVPDAKIDIYDVFGHKIHTIILTKKIVPAFSERILTEKGFEQDSSILWGNNNLFGIYSADLSVSLSSKGPVLVKKIAFILIPFQLSILFITIFLIVTLIGIKAYFKIKRNDSLRYTK